MNGIAYLGITGYATVEDMKYIARHFAEWQRQQMLKEAMEGTYAVTTVGHFAFFTDKPINDLCLGDKVKIVIVKEDKK